MSVEGGLPSDVGSKLIAIHRALEAICVPHAFGGAIALAYGTAAPRATYDIDINVSVPVADAAKVLDRLPEGVEARPDVEERILRHGQDRLRWGDVPVDLFFPQHRFHSVVAARAPWVPFRDTVIQVITPTDLTVFKTMFNRSKDWPDIEAMLRAGSVDVDEALRWIGEILGPRSAGYARLEETAARVTGPRATDFPEELDSWAELRDRHRSD